MTNTIKNANVNTNATNTAAVKTKPARRRYDFRAVINRAAAESDSALISSESAAESIKNINVDNVIRHDVFDNARLFAVESRNAYTNAREYAAAALNLENAKKPNGAKKLEKLEKLANAAAAESAAARAAAESAAAAAALCTKAYTAAEKREKVTAEIYAKIDGKTKPAEIWEIISEYGYTVIKRDFFIKALGKESGGAYYRDINNLALDTIHSILKFADTAAADDENAAFNAIREYTKRIGIKATFTADTVKTIANRAYTYKRLYGDGFTPNSIGGARFIVEIIGAVTNPDALKKAAAESAAKKARRDSRKKAAAAKNSK